MKSPGQKKKRFINMKLVIINLDFQDYEIIL